MIASNFGGLVLLQNSFHWARGIIAMPLSSGISNLVPIVGGIIAFDESLPPDSISVTLRIAAFILTILASVLVAGARRSAQLIMKAMFAYQMCRNVMPGRPFAGGAREVDIVHPIPFLDLEAVKGRLRH